jgi:PPE-repeat protein
MEFAVLPPQINSAAIYSGPGSESDAGRFGGLGWLASELSSAASSELRAYVRQVNPWALSAPID